MIALVKYAAPQRNKSNKDFTGQAVLRNLTQFISHRLGYAGENFKGSTVTARAYLMCANLFDAGGL